MSRRNKKIPATSNLTSRAPDINSILIITAFLAIIIVFTLAAWWNPLRRDLFLLISAAATFISFCLALWYVPKWQVRHLKVSDLKPNEVFELENEARKTVAQIFGGIFVLISLYFGWQNFDHARRTSEAGMLRDRITRAVEQFESKNREVRVGGIYSLGRIAQTHEQEHWQIMQMLMAFAREKAPWKEEVTTEATEGTKEKKLVPTPTPPQETVDIAAAHPPNDIQAVMDVLRQRVWSNENEHQQLMLEALRLVKVSLRGAYLRRASFFGTDLSGADLTNVNLENAVLNWTTLWLADLTDANLKGADLTRAKLRADTVLDGADLEGAILTKAELSGVDLSKVRNLSWEQILDGEVKFDCKTRLPNELDLKKKDILKCP